MPALNTRLKLPAAALWYSALGAFGVSIVIFLGGAFLMFEVSTLCSGGGCTLLSPAIIFPFIIAIVVVALAYPVLYWLLFSYELTPRTITINSGILFREYETIDFGRIQAVDNERGPLLWFFELTEVRIWTASADQLAFSVGGGTAQARPHPDAKLVLTQDDARVLKDFIMRSKTDPSGL
jgi:membrane protein YdbS with pleckstrin-like domain